MFDVSLPTANALFGLSNVTLIIGAALVLLGTLGVVWFGGIRERFADNRISENETKTVTALAESARANAELEKSKVELEKERIERLRLEEKVQPRHLSESQKSALIGELKSSGWAEAEIVWHGTGEPEAYARNLANAFEAANIKTTVHTLGPFIPSAWGLMIVKTQNGASARLKKIFEDVGIESILAEPNDMFVNRVNPTLVVGSRTE